MLTKRKVKHVLPLATLVLITALASVMPTMAKTQAAATAASLELSSDTFLNGSPVTIRVYDVTAAGASFGITFFYDLTGTETLEAKSAYANRSIQLGTGQDEWIITMIFEEPTAGDYIRVKVVGALTDTTAVLATAQIDAVDPETLLPTDLIITVGVALMIILIVVGIVVGLARRGSRR